MNNDFIPPPPNDQNPNLLKDLLSRLDAQVSINRQFVDVNQKTSELLTELMDVQRIQGESIAKIAMWIDSQQK